MADEHDKHDPAARTSGASASESARSGGDSSPTDIQAYIGRQLRAVYDDVAKQPIPDRFLALMQQLEAKSAS